MNLDFSIFSAASLNKKIDEKYETVMICNGLTKPFSVCNPAILPTAEKANQTFDSHIASQTPCQTEHYLRYWFLNYLSIFTVNNRDIVRDLCYNRSQVFHTRTHTAKVLNVFRGSEVQFTNIKYIFIHASQWNTNISHCPLHLHDKFHIAVKCERICNRQ